MAKNYILEPIEIEFKLQNGSLTPISPPEIASKPNIPVGSIFDINGDKFIIASHDEDEGVYSASRDGIPPTSATPERVRFIIRENEIITLNNFNVYSNVTNTAGTYTVSIYTETEDDPTPKYPIKNTSYELHGHSDVERIRYKLKKKAEQGDSSGGGSNVVVINSEYKPSEDGDSYVLDMTYSEIFDAADSGAVLVICCHGPHQITTFELVTVVGYEDDKYTVETIGTYENNPDYRSYIVNDQDDYPTYYVVS